MRISDWSSDVCSSDLLGRNRRVIMSGSPPLEADVMETRGIEDLAAKLAGILPPGLRSLRGELEDNFRAVLRANLEKWDLVSRERFDTQAELLARTQIGRAHV